MSEIVMRNLVSELEWAPLRGIDRSRLGEARLQAHYAAQWLARFSRAYIPPQQDDGHTSLIWDHNIEGFKTQTLKNGTRLSLQIRNLTLALNSGDGQVDVDSIFLSGRTNSEIREWLADCLGKRDVDSTLLDKPSPYTIPSHPIGKRGSYNAAASAEALTELATWFSNANTSIVRTERDLVGSQMTTSPVRCWPHHFDLATLTTLAQRSADSIGYVGTGFSPGDEHYDEPYFYVSIYPRPDSAALPALPMLGHWHTRDFIAAVLPAHKIIAAKNRRVETEEFLGSAISIILKLLN